MASQAGDADSSRAPGLTSGLQGSVNVHRGALLLVPQWQCISFFFSILQLHFGPQHYPNSTKRTSQTFFPKVWPKYSPLKSIFWDKLLLPEHIMHAPLLELIFLCSLNFLYINSRRSWSIVKILSADFVEVTSAQGCCTDWNS